MLAARVEVPCERENVSGACIRDRAALLGRESTYSTSRVSTLVAFIAVGCQERRGID